MCRSLSPTAALPCPKVISPRARPAAREYPSRSWLTAEPWVEVLPNSPPPPPPGRRPISSIMISAVSLHWEKAMWFLMMRNDFRMMLVEEDLQHNACNLLTWGGGKTPIVFADHHTDVCLAWSAVSSFSQLVGCGWSA